MSPKTETYDKLTREFRDIATLGTCEAILSWDEVTYMPEGGAEHRANQKALLAGLFHKKATAPTIGEWLSELESSELAKNGNPQAANVRELRRQYNKMVKLPESLVTEITKVTSLAHPI